MNMGKILILHSSIDGQTVKICERLRAIVADRGHEVALAAIGDTVDPDAFDAIVIGASIRYGKHRPAVFDFVERHRALLERKPSAFFSVNIVARKAAKNRPETNPYVIKFLRRTRWKPALTGVFAGRLDYPKYRFFDRLMIRFIMLLTKGPTAPDTVVEFTDWKSVEAFGCALAGLDKDAATGA
jgi:menaquinone-dependent protoporphyrinogen oxidase